MRIILLLIIAFSCSKENSAKDQKVVKKVDEIEKRDSLLVKKENSYKAPTGRFKKKTVSKMITAIIRSNLGDMSFELFPNESPLATENFINLAKAGFYKENDFFRVVSEFVVQTGDKTNTAYGDAGYYFKSEHHPDLSHDRKGFLSFANNGPNSNSSQFFITLSSQRHLDENHPIFGLLMKGEAVLDKIGSVEVDERNHPLKRVYIKDIEIKD